MMRRIAGSAIAILVLCSAAFALQEKISPLSDYQYNKKDYPQYLEIKKETDIQKRADLLLAFIKERPVSRVLIYAVSDYMESLKPVLDKKDWTKAIALQEGLMALLPTEKTLQEAGVPAEAQGEAGLDDFKKRHILQAQILIQRSLLSTYYQAKNLPKAAEAAEKMYALAPDKALYFTLAAIYLEMQNFDKYLEYGKKILAEYSMEQAYQTAYQMAQVYIQKSDVNSARDLFSKMMEAYGEKLPPNLTDAQWNPVRAVAYGVLASGVYEKKEYPKAQELFEKVVQFDPKNDDAYYYIGMCKWRNNDAEGAIEPFAKCVVLNKARAKTAQQYLEQIYKARHSDSLDGLDKVLAKAKADLGIS